MTSLPVIAPAAAIGGALGTLALATFVAATQRKSASSEPPKRPTTASESGSWKARMTSASMAKVVLVAPAPAMALPSTIPRPSAKYDGATTRR